MSDYQLWLGDCLEEMNRIEAGSIDMICADLPYGTTACKWDVVIPFEPLWSHYKRVIKRNGAIVLFGSEPFSSFLRLSNLDWYKYDWVWDKKMASGFVYAKARPMQAHEELLVFCEGGPVYNPQMIERTPEQLRRYIKAPREEAAPSHYGGLKTTIKPSRETSQYRHPNTVIRINGVNGASQEKAIGKHPTQKPVALLEYLIKTYSNEGDLVLDNTFGSCSTGVGCLNTGRRFIGIEKDPNYFRIGEERMKQRALEIGLQPNEAHSSYDKTDTDKSGYQLGLPQLRSQIHETA